MAHMGPPDPVQPADAMLEMIKKHQAEPAPEYEQQSILKAVLPLLLAQGVDMFTTESLMSQPSPPGWLPPKEQNPLPGMQSTAGRLGNQALEAALVGLLMRKKPKFGGMVRNGLTVMHTGAAMGNEQNIGENQMHMRTHAAKGR